MKIAKNCPKCQEMIDISLISKDSKIECTSCGSRLQLRVTIFSQFLFGLAIGIMLAATTFLLSSAVHIKPAHAVLVASLLAIPILHLFIKHVDPFRRTCRLILDQ